MVNPLIDDTNQRILQLAADGYRIVEIAARLPLSQHAVSNRLYNIRRGLGATTTAEAVKIALKRGYIT